MTKAGVDKLQAEVTAVDGEIAAKRAEVSRFTAMQGSASEAAEAAAKDQAAALVANDETRLATAAETEARAIRDARNAAAAASLLAGELSTLERQQAERRAALADAIEVDRRSRLQAALVKLRDVLTNEVEAIETIATDTERASIGQEIARAFGRTDWTAAAVASAIDRGAEAVRPAAPYQDPWSGIEVGIEVAIAALREIRWRGPAIEHWVPAGTIVNCPMLFAERFCEMGAALKLADRAFTEQEIRAIQANNTQAWRGKVRTNSGELFLAHPSRWPTARPVAFGDQAPPNRPVQGIVAAAAFAEARAG